MKIGIIGLGQMGEALVLGLRQAKGLSVSKVVASTRSQESADEAKKRLGIDCSTSNLAVVKSADLILLAVKPYQAEKVLKEVSKGLNAKKILVSVCASLTTSQLEKWSGGKCVVIRAMPNTPCLIGEGMTVLAGGSKATAKELDLAESVFASVGRTSRVDESLMDGVTGLSGCGPAYVYLIIEALSEAGVKVGLPRETATLLAAQTMLGASKMVLERNVHPAALKDEVTTPAGCTIDGLMALEEGKIRVALIKAVLAATERSRTLREK